MCCDHSYCAFHLWHEKHEITCTARNSDCHSHQKSKIKNQRENTDNLRKFMKIILFSWIHRLFLLAPWLLCVQIPVRGIELPAFVSFSSYLGISYVYRLSCTYSPYNFFLLAMTLRPLRFVCQNCCCWTPAGEKVPLATRQIPCQMPNRKFAKYCGVFFPYGKEFCGDCMHAYTSETDEKPQN